MEAMEERSSGSGSSFATSRTAASFASMLRSSMAGGRRRAASGVASEPGRASGGDEKWRDRDS
uniref:Uncharacterized protein n=1 Tax=Arundo donax TaxID=35708 RepID=A0A0A9GDH2_ARUDO